MNKKNKILICGIVAISFVVIMTTILVYSCGIDGVMSKYQINKANKYLAEMNYEIAIKAYKEAIRLNPEDKDAYIGLAKTYALMEDYEMSVTILELGLEKTGSAKNVEAYKEIDDLLYTMIEIANDDNNIIISSDTSIKNANQNLQETTSAVNRETERTTQEKTTYEQVSTERVTQERTTSAQTVTEKNIQETTTVHIEPATESTTEIVTEPVIIEEPSNSASNIVVDKVFTRDTGDSLLMENIDILVLTEGFYNFNDQISSWVNNINKLRKFIFWRYLGDGENISQDIYMLYRVDANRVKAELYEYFGINFNLEDLYVPENDRNNRAYYDSGYIYVNSMGVGSEGWCKSYILKEENGTLKGYFDYCLFLLQDYDLFEVELSYADNNKGYVIKGIKTVDESDSKYSSIINELKKYR